MAQRTVGGFLVEVGAKINQDSFEKGKRNIDNMANAVSRLVGTIRNSAPLILAGTAGVVETAELKAADAIGISTEALDAWKTSAQIAGVNANALVNDMNSLEQKMQRIKNGQFDEQLAVNLQRMGLNYMDLVDMDGTERLLAVFEAASKMSDQALAAVLVGDSLGNAAKSYYQYLRLSGKSAQELLNYSKGLVFTTDASKRDAMGFNEQMQALRAAMTSISMLAGSEFGKELIPVLQELNKFISDNKDNIKSVVDSLAAFGGDAIKATIPVLTDLTKACLDLMRLDWDAFGENLTKSLSGLGTLGNVTGYAIEAALNGTSYADAAEKHKTDQYRLPAFVALSKEVPRDWTSLGLRYKKKSFEELSPETQALVNAAGGPAVFSDFIKDGIISPDGRVTKVSPDDWVFAARDLGDLAQAFIPTGAANNATVTYSIQQNFTINNSKNTGFDVKRMAYEGTNKALNENINQSTKRIQLMPSTF